MLTWPPTNNNWDIDLFSLITLPWHRHCVALCICSEKKTFINFFLKKGQANDVFHRFNFQVLEFLHCSTMLAIQVDV